MSTRLPPIFILASAFLVLAPLSVSTGTSLSEPAKYLRVLVTMCMVGLWCISKHQRRLGTASLATLVFVSMFVGASLYSDLPQWALFHKGMFALSCLSGIAIVSLCRSHSEFQKGLEFLGLVSIFAALITFVLYRAAPDQSTVHDRVTIMGLNANGVGHSAASFSFLCAYLAVHSRRRLFRIASLLATALLAVLVVGSGSRGSLICQVLGIAIIVSPAVKRSPRLVFAIFGAFALGVAIYSTSDMSGGSRLVEEFGKDTRSKVWSVAFQVFQQSPIIGHGWLHRGRAWATVQSAYLQVLLETGVVGFAVLTVAIVAIVISFVRGGTILTRKRVPKGVYYFAGALLSTSLLHAVFESSLIAGTSIAPLLFGIGVGLTDCMPALSETCRDLRYNAVRWVYVQVAHQVDSVEESAATSI